jgi:peptidoglycan/xylan/chitin deacetylase (PgdA/CDA1 family)
LGRFYWSSIIFLFLAGVCFFLFSGTVRSVVILFLCISYFIIFSLGVSVLRLNFFCHAVCRGKAGAKRVALTFDDGPDPEATPAVLAVLDRYGIKAAFFCIGKKVAQYPEIARRIVDEGHIIANHGYHHFWWTNFSMFKGLNREMAKAQEAIKSVIGKSPAFFRPLAGLTNPHIDRALNENSLICVGWDVRPFDTRRKKKQVVNTIVRKIRDGSIILLHDTARPDGDITEIMEEVITILKKRGFSFSALDELTGIKPYLENKRLGEMKTPVSIMDGLNGWLAQTGVVRRALADEVTLDEFKGRPSAKFIIGLSLIAFSYMIGWPAVAFFAFLAVYLDVKKIALLGPVSYIFSHFVFIAGAALAGVDGVKYGHLFSRWLIHRFARRVANKIQGTRFKG